MSGFTFQSLLASTIRFKPWRRNYSQNYRMNIAAIIPYVGTKSVLFQGSCNGLTQRAIHRTNMLFSGVDIIKRDPNSTEEDKPDLNKYIEVTYKGDLYYIEKPNPRVHLLSVRCTCADFFWRFAWADHIRGCLYGPAPRPYRRPRVKPPVNPRNIPALCKHVYNMYSFLRASGYTTEQGLYR
jgi:hypothetical protein